MKFQQTFINCFLFLILFLSFVLSKEIHSSPVAEICEFDQIEFALDPDLSNEVPKEPKKSLVFLPKENSFLKLGFIKESVWIRFNIKQYPRSRCFLRIPQVTLDGAALFAKSSVQITGDRFRYSERFVDDYYPVFYLEPLDIQKEKINIIFGSKRLLLSTFQFFWNPVWNIKKEIIIEIF
ncbi:7TMR-DISM extracellular 2 [Leptospira interrogans serovar Australis str. 200703203]|uniref:7TMR-DISM extracellular 2 n=3 Tax=Leptospira interrogans TaxID=173 RepID=M6HL47_LEPIR|nr:7TMR-DISM extracellular 2 [Leptospira interrogans serovar Zanoni str. LT2156]EMN73963.1 7TMR-DISM extracellular 2 [Leptospira interrogans serovar Bataviae str. UI 08561]EMY27806.1 7TMR-DISM extracellular 2 [Leptospira interrogans serovar Australis str. 200703203]